MSGYSIEDIPITFRPQTGKILAVYFWHPSDREIHKQIEESMILYRRFHSHGLDAISVYTTENEDDVFSLLDQWKMTWTQVLNSEIEDGLPVKKFNVIETKKNYLLDANGKVIAKDFVGDEAHKIVAECLNINLDEISMSQTTVASDVSEKAMNNLGDNFIPFLNSQEKAAINDTYHRSCLILMLDSAELVIRDGETIRTCAGRLQSREGGQWFLYKHFQPAGGIRQKDTLNIILSDKPLTQTSFPKTHELWGTKFQDIKTVLCLDSDPLLTEFAKAMSNKGISKISDRNMSQGYFRPIEDGEIILVKNRNNYYAVQLLEQRRKESNGKRFESLRYS